jgi:hypothetical protein
VRQAPQADRVRAAAATVFAVLVAFVVTYLAQVQIFKQRFYAASGWRGQ